VARGEPRRRGRGRYRARRIQARRPHLRPPPRL